MRFAKPAYIILWVFWVMLFVRFGFRIGLIGIGRESAVLSTVLFTCTFCVLIPFSLLTVHKDHIRRLVWTAIPFCLTGIAALLLLDEEYIYIASMLLSAGSALLTSLFLYIYVFGLSRREQIISIVIFLLAKPVFSLTALLFSETYMILPYTVLALAIIIAIGFCGKYIDITDDSANNNRHSIYIAPKSPVAFRGGKMPVWIYIGVYALFALIVFERMNCAYVLFLKGNESPALYYFYFAGGILMALAAYWIFVHKKAKVSVALNIFLFLTIIYFSISIAIESGLMVFSSISMSIFGFSDIVYVFLFVTAASISKAHPNRKVFMGFVFVFGFALLCAFAFSRYLLMTYHNIYMIIYSLTSLAIIAACILLVPMMNRIETNFMTKESNSRKSKGKQLKTTEYLNPEENSAHGSIAHLTARENEIINLYLKGYSNQQVSEELCIAPTTLKVHCRNIYEKLKIKSRLELHLLFQFSKKNEDI